MTTRTKPAQIAMENQNILLAREVEKQFWWEDEEAIFVSKILEERASEEQKARKIDLIEFLFEEPSNSSIIR